MNSNVEGRLGNTFGVFIRSGCVGHSCLAFLAPSLCYVTHDPAAWPARCTFLVSRALPFGKSNVFSSYFSLCVGVPFLASPLTSQVVHICWKGRGKSFAFLGSDVVLGKSTCTFLGTNLGFGT